MMAVSMESVVAIEPELETVLMVAEAHLISGYQSCHRSSERIALLTQIGGGTLDQGGATTLPFISMALGYKSLIPRPNPL
jgi:hypothetical protein